MFKGLPWALLKILQGANHHTAYRLSWLMQDRGCQSHPYPGKRTVTLSHQKFPAFPIVHGLPLQHTSEHGPRQVRAFTHTIKDPYRICTGCCDLFLKLFCLKLFREYLLLRGGCMRKKLRQFPGTPCLWGLLPGFRGHGAVP